MMIIRKVLQLLVVLVIVSFLTSMLVQALPGDPARAMLPFATDAQLKPVRTELGLNKPWYDRYGSWVSGVAHGDLGNYYNPGGSKRPVSDTIKQALPISIELMLFAQIISLAIAIPLGVATAHRANTRFDRLTSTGAFGLLALPSFALGLILAYFVGVKWQLLPPSGFRHFTSDPFGNIRSLILPSVSLAAGQVAIYMRLLRTDMVATLQEDFILMAKAKGISERRVLWRHALRPSSLTLLTVAGLNVGTLIGSAIVIEQVFQIPGMGFVIATAIFTRQYLALQSAVVVVAAVYVIVNFGLDFLYNVLDPRIRTRRA